MTNGLDKRLAKLEAEAGGEVIVMWQHHTETPEQARERWISEHPGRDLNRASRVLILGWSIEEAGAARVQA